VAFDRDPGAAGRAQPLSQELGAAFRFFQRSFADVGEALDQSGMSAALDGAILDLGLSSFQLGDPERGFSFAADGPLDMRFDPDQPQSAAEVVNRYPEERLRQVLKDLGQESWAAPIAAAVVRERRKAPLLTTSALASLVSRVIPRPLWPKRIHPATKTFQALRMEVNDELGQLGRGLEEITKRLKPGGRFGVIAFHSLEDKLVKDFFNVEARDCICPPRQPVCTCHHRATLAILTPHPLRPGTDEIGLNPRSRSARLRAAERLPS
jgi:16S rRNA (cytosine1402-N4)-methyltransferase